MHLRSLLALVILLTTSAFADDSPQRYADAHSLWEKTRDRAEYQQYLDEFVQYNNDLHLDEKDSCYRLAPGSVNLMLVILHRDGEEFAVVQSAFSDVDNAKARCFKKTYEGLRTKVPPFLPFALQMAMG
jgi:hypothetical protein